MTFYENLYSKMKILFSIALFVSIVFITKSHHALYGQNSRQADSLFVSAQKHLEQNKNTEAITKFQDAFEIYKKLGLYDKTKQTQYYIGLTYASKFGNWKKAEEHWLQALDYATKQGDDLMQARISGNLGIVYDKMGSYQKSEKFHNEALAYYKKTENLVKETAQHINIGLLNLNQSDYNAALKHFERALDIAEKEKLTNETGKIIYNIGYVRYKQGKYGQAYNAYIKALKTFGNTISLSDKAELLNNLGTIYKAYSDTETALEYYNNAMQACTTLGNKDLKARILNNIGNLYHNQNNYKQAITHFTQALTLEKEVGNKLNQAITLNNIGEVYKSMKQFDDAKKYYRQSLDIKNDLGYIWGEAYQYYCFGDLFQEMNEYQLAKIYYDSASVFAEKIDAAGLTYKIFSACGDLSMQQYDTLAAETNYHKSIDIIESIRDGIGIETDRRHFIQSVVPVYKKYIGLKIKQNKTDEAFEYLERMKIRNLSNITNGGFAMYQTAMTGQEKRKQNELDRQIRSLNRDIKAYYAKNTKNVRNVAIDFLVEKRKEIRKLRKQFERELYNNHPELRRFIESGDPIAYKDAVKLLKNDEEAAIIYVVQDTVTNCFVLRGFESKDLTIETYEFPITKKKLHEMTQDIVEDWEVHKMDEFYDLLIRPLKKSLEGVNQLCILPDSYLNYIPFQALKNTETNHYLIEDFAIYYVYSLSLLSELRSNQTYGRDSILAFGNPNFGNSGIKKMNQVFVALPKSEQEVISIGKIYGDKSQILLFNEASETNFKKRAKDYGVLHLATHGIFDEIDPMSSSVLLSADRKEDGFLSAGEIIKMKMNADLVVLSACETAKGKFSEGQEMLGLSRAFFGASVPTIIGSLWQVDDQSTKILMETFHNNSNNKIVNYAKALQAAQINLLRNTKYSDPYFWAPFVLVGDSE